MQSDFVFGKNNEKGNINDTKYLLEDESYCNNNMNNNLSLINRKFNNTQLLLDEKTSILIEDSQKNQFEESKSNEHFNQLLKQENSLLQNDFSNNVNISKSIDDILSFSKTNTNNNNTTTNKIVPEIQFDLSFVNFGIVFPTEKKVVKLKIKNISKTASVIEFKISEKENLKEYFSEYNDICDNSNLKFPDIFKILNSQCKVTLNKQEEIEVEIQILSPLLKTSQKIFGLLEVYNNNFIDKAIPLFCNLEVPKISCLKSLQSDFKSKIPLIPIKVELRSKGQKYKLPFKNFSMKEITVELSINKKYNNDFYYSDNAQVYKVNVMFFPNTLTIAPQSVSFAEMIIKVCKESNKENNNSANTASKKCTGKIRKWVTMKIQKSNICYSMFIDGVVKEEKN